MEGVEEQEVVLFHSYPCPYYVQSPSTASHANSADIRNASESAFHSPLGSGSHHRNPTQEASRFTLSHYSSSRGSNHSFLQEKKIIVFDDTRSHEVGTDNGETRLIVVGRDGGVDGDGGKDGVDHEDDGDYGDGGYYGKKRGGCWKRYLTYKNSDSSAWICLQLIWRAVFSVGIALLVFYIATKPPSPKIAIKIERIEFMLGEGVDNTGVSTKILTCNFTINLTVDNKSKLFGLHIFPPFLQISFGHLSFATSQGPRLYAESGSTTFQLSVGTTSKPMYGAGRSMEDLLESETGLNLTVRLNFVSNFRVVWKIIRPRFHHRVECSLVIGKAYNRKRRTQTFNSTCTLY